MKKNASRVEGYTRACVRQIAASCFAALACFAPPAASQTSDLVQRSALRVCADPANMPYSNMNREGFENRIAGLIGRKLDIPVVYTWFPQATGFVRQTLRANKCDIIIGFAQGHELVQNTNHYYRSTYVLVHKSGGKLERIVNLNDPRLKSSRIGAIAGTPPVTVLALNALLTQMKPYPLMVDRRYESPAEKMLADLDTGEIDAAILWGPIAGYFAKQSKQKLTLVPLNSETKGPRMSYRITFGIRRGEPNWKHQLNELIASNQDKINTILLEYGIPILDERDQLVKQ